MKIVKEGTVPGSILSGRCDCCKCEVECTQSEVRTNEKVRSDDADYWVDCPTEGCGSRIYFWQRWR